ncbi:MULTISPECIES: hypothetical protein [Acinetobacter]|uniref:hypothetical protein n=1 Tax=Acinetobacter TaxID=469 RepID=UPI0002D0BE9E|nr:MULTISPECIES: hypothetical protein [Acinetobacter]ENV07412.1 hypothetical protein F967_00208 [Acinetobacter sp. CIP 102637]QUS49781.1 hypothetical protein J5N61_15190 [Acinetobacter junii]
MSLKALKTDLSPCAQKKLNSFKASANPSMNKNFNSSDELKWYDFILQVHLDKCEIDFDVFQQWLMQDVKFSETAATILTDRLSSGLSLLKHYKKDDFT